MKIFKIILMIVTVGFMRISFGAGDAEEGRWGVRFTRGLALVLPEVVPSKGVKRGMDEREESPEIDLRKERESRGDLKRCNSDPTESRAKRLRGPKKTLSAIIKDWEGLSDKNKWLNQLDGLPYPYKQASSQHHSLT